MAWGAYKDSFTQLRTDWDAMASPVNSFEIVSQAGIDDLRKNYGVHLTSD